MESFESFENDQNNQLEEILLNTQEQCQMVEHLIKNQIEVKDQMIDKLHKELEFYKQDYADKFTDQLMKAVIRVRKSMQRCMTAGDWETLDVSQVRKEYRYAFEDLTDLLEQQNGMHIPQNREMCLMLRSIRQSSKKRLIHRRISS